jgi:integrase
VSLAVARERRQAARAEVRAGRDPANIMRRKVVEQVRQEERAVTRNRQFATVARDWYANQQSGRRWEPMYAPRVWNRLDRFVLPTFGPRDIGGIKPKDVLGVLRAMESRGLGDSVLKVKSYINGIFQFAIAEELVEGNPVRDIGGGLAPQPKSKSQPWFRAERLPDFWHSFHRPHDDAEMTRIAMRLYMHTVLRSRELRMGRWDQIRGDEWHIPEGQMKRTTGTSPRAAAILSRREESGQVTIARGADFVPSPFTSLFIELVQVLSVHLSFADFF